MTDDDLLQLLHDTADAVAVALARVTDWGLSGAKHGQYKADLAADAAALGVLRRAGVGVLSEESGLERADRSIVVVVDPLDGSTNASQGLPWYATALCALDADGPRVGLVANQAGGPRYTAVRGGGAFVGERRLVPSGCTDVTQAVLGLNGLPPRHLGWEQFRVMGAAALDLCAVADGVLDGYLDCTPASHGVWDYCASLLICREAGARCEDAQGRELVVRDHAARRTPVAAATPELMATLMAARATF
jgi:fructose-1,6-bisphosphatase/inositol monophosphatase family enzyme